MVFLDNFKFLATTIIKLQQCIPDNQEFKQESMKMAVSVVTFEQNWLKAHKDEVKPVYVTLKKKLEDQTKELETVKPPAHFNNRRNDKYLRTKLPFLSSAPGQSFNIPGYHLH